jgi:hypothetical protein
MGFWFENKLSGNPDPDKAFYLVHRLKPNLFITFVSGGVERAAGEEGGRGRRGGEERGGSGGGRRCPQHRFLTY